MPIKYTRKFGNTTYSYWNPYKNKKDAEQTAKALRIDGHRARVVKGKDCYRVYYS